MSSCSALPPRSIAQMLWNIADNNAWTEEQGGLQPKGRLVMQEIFPPVRDHKFG